jgi:pimeloyl-ACP methyl ester carboxylesterase
MLTGGELVVTQTDDQIRLHGFFLPAQSTPKIDVDAAIFTHAVAGNFYNSRFLTRLAASVGDLGINVLVGNNRGHDVINYLSASGARQTVGAAHEIVADCQLDLAAWVSLLRQRGFRRILIAGHSLGAIKTLFAQAHKPQKEVVGLATFSASRLCYQDFIDSPSQDRFLHWLNLAKKYKNAGDDQRLLDVDFPFPVLISANTYIDKYDSSDRYNWLKYVDKIQVPTLLAFGEQELAENPAFHGIIEQFNALELSEKQFCVTTVAKANHYYTGCQQNAADELCRWIRATFSK